MGSNAGHNFAIGKDGQPSANQPARTKAALGSTSNWGQTLMDLRKTGQGSGRMSAGIGGSGMAAKAPSLLGANATGFFSGRGAQAPLGPAPAFDDDQTAEAEAWKQRYGRYPRWFTQ